jgi:hypothetical protein
LVLWHTNIARLLDEAVKARHAVKVVRLSVRFCLCWLFELHIFDLLHVAPHRALERLDESLNSSLFILTQQTSRIFVPFLNFVEVFAQELQEVAGD